MLTHYSYQELSEIWLLKMGHIPLRTDTSLSRVDGYNLADLLQLEINQWYLNLLDSAPLDMLPVESVATDVKNLSVSDGIVTFDLPARCRRPVAVKLGDWRVAATPFTACDNPRLAALQQSVYTRGGACHPVAVIEGRKLMLYSTSAAAPVLEQLDAVVEPAEGDYILDPSLLSTIPEFINQNFCLL